jgi:retron-type reverse transcriptase
MMIVVQAPCGDYLLRAREPPAPILRQILRAGVMEDGQVRRPVTGTPQGGVISPLMCNVYLHRLDRAWDEHDGILVRYADDLVVMCFSRSQAERALEGPRSSRTGTQ